MDIGYLEFSKLVEKQVKKSGTRHYFYVYEIRRLENEKFVGLHCHLLVETTIRPYDYKRGLKNTFKSVSMVDNPEILNVKNITEDLLADKIRYMLGEKKKQKQSAVELTDLWRDREKILTHFESNPPFPCRVAQTITE